MLTYSIFDDDVSEAILRFVGIPDNFQNFCESQITDDYSLAEWVYNFCLLEFNQFCIANYSFSIRECL